MKCNYNVKLVIKNMIWILENICAAKLDSTIKHTDHTIWQEIYPRKVRYLPSLSRAQMLQRHFLPVSVNATYGLM